MNLSISGTTLGDKAAAAARTAPRQKLWRKTKLGEKAGCGKVDSSHWKVKTLELTLSGVLKKWKIIKLTRKSVKNTLIQSNLFPSVFERVIARPNVSYTSVAPRRKGPFSWLCILLDAHESYLVPDCSTERSDLQDTLLQKKKNIGHNSGHLCFILRLFHTIPLKIQGEKPSRSELGSAATYLEVSCTSALAKGVGSQPCKMLLHLSILHHGSHNSAMASASRASPL